MHILIVGAGPAGLALALALSRHGLRARIVERAPRLNTGGYVIGLQANGWDAAERLGILPALRAQALPASDSVYRDRAGRELFRFRHHLLAELTGGKLIYVPRDALVALLAEALPQDPQIGFNAVLTALEQHGDHVTARFADGTAEDFDLVVGADGIHSAVRRLALTPEPEALRPLGYRGAAWRMPFDGTLDPGIEGHMEIGRQAILYQTEPGEIATLLCWRCDDLAPVPAHARRAVVTEAFAGTLPLLAHLIDGPVDWSYAFVDGVSQIEMSRWSTGRVVLLGDAAWCLSFLSGQGASMAMAGACVLAEELMRAPLPEALSRYEARLRPTLLAAQKHARSTARTYVPTSRLGLWLRDRTMPLTASPLVLKWRLKALVADTLLTDPQAR